MSEKKSPEVKPAKLETRSLYVPLTEDEVRLRSQEMATAERILAEAEADEDTQAEAWKACKKALETTTADARAKLSIVGRIVREKRELRAVEIVEERNHTLKTVDTIRTDTGEIIETRGMTESEMQRSLFELQKTRKIDDGEGAAAQA